MGDPIQSPLDVLASLQSSTRLRLFIVGGFAVNAHGFSRFTADLDCLVVTEDLAAVAEAFKSAGYNRCPGTNVAAIFEHPDARPRIVDVILVNMQTFEKMWPHRVPTSFEGREFFIPAIEHMFAMKLHAVKVNPRRWGKDLRDLHELVRAHPDVCTRKKVMELCRQFGPADRQHDILEFILAYAQD